MMKALMIAYHYHPDLSVGAIRTIKFAKYMPAYGWTPIILTVKQKYYPKVESVALTFDRKVYRTIKLPVLDDFAKYILRKIRRRNRSKISTTQTGKIPDYVDTFNKTDVPLWKRTWNSLSRLPDENMGWLIPGLLTAIRLVFKEKIDIIYTSGPPYTCHVIGLLTSLITRRPLVADFRDPWSTNRQPQEIETAFTRWLRRFLERKLVSRAKCVLATTPELTEVLKGLYGDFAADKIHTLFNGFDDDDFKRRKKLNLNPGRPLTMLYAGNLYRGRDPYALMIAVGELLQESKLKKNEIKIVFLGAVTIDTAKIKKAIVDFDLGDIVEFQPTVGRNEYLEKLFAADILILVQAPNQAALIPAKTFEYLATGNEIIALLPDGAASRFLAGFENVAMADIFDKDGIKKGLITILDRIRSGRRVDLSDDERLLSFTRRRLTGDLCRLFDKVVKA